MDKLAFLMIKYDTPYLIKRFQNIVDEDDVYKYGDADYGLEFNSHVTLAPCLDNTITVDELKVFLDPIYKYDVKIGCMSMFECDDYDVLKYDVTSQRLIDTNKRIGEEYKMHTEYKYHPHMTAAYMKKGRAEKYLDGRFDHFPMVIMPKHFIWSYYDNGGNQQTLNFF